MNTALVKNKKRVTTAWTVLVGFLLPVLVWAIPDDGFRGRGQTFGSLVGDLVGLINTLVVILVSLSLLVFFWGLALFLLKAGDASANARGRELMIWGILAFFVMSSVWGIVRLIGGSIF